MFRHRITLVIQGAADPTTAGDHFNAMSFIAKQVLSGAWTVTLAQVKSVTNAGEVKDTGTVSLQPLVNQVDGQGNATPHGTISNAIYFRYGGKDGAIICDPVVGDIGIMLSASSDISSVKANKAQANPGSSRKFDPADAIYLGAVLSAAPTQYITFTSTGLKIADKNNNAIEFKQGGIFVTGNIVVQGNLAAVWKHPESRTATRMPAPSRRRAMSSPTTSACRATITRRPTDRPDRPSHEDLVARCRRPGISSRTSRAISRLPASRIRSRRTPRAQSSCSRASSGTTPRRASRTFEQILGKAPNIALIKAKFTDAAKTVPGVVSAKVFISSIVNRAVSGQVQVTDANGNTTAATFVVLPPGN